MSPTSRSIRMATEHLAGVAAMLHADGYDLAVTSAGGSFVAVTISTGAEACADCLVGSDLLEHFIRSELVAGGQFGTDVEVALTMPDRDDG